MCCASSHEKRNCFRLIQSVRLNQRHARRAIHTADDRGVIAGHEISDNRRLQIVRRWYAGRDDLGFLIAPPVIIRSDDRPIAVMQLQRRISQRSRHCERRAHCTHDYSERLLPQHDQSADQDIVARLNKATRGNICQLRIDRPVQVVHFHQAYSGPVVEPAYSRRVSHGICLQNRHNGRFQIVARRYAGRDDLRLLIAPPIVVRRNQIAKDSA